MQSRSSIDGRSTERTAPTTAIDPLPAELGSPRAKLVLLYLQVRRAATPDELHRTLGIGRLALFPILDVLDERGFVRRDGNAVAYDSVDASRSGAGPA